MITHPDMEHLCSRKAEAYTARHFLGQKILRYSQGTVYMESCAFFVAMLLQLRRSDFEVAHLLELYLRVDRHLVVQSVYQSFNLVKD